VPDAVCWTFIARVKKNEESVKNRMVNCGRVFTILLKKRISELPLVTFVARLQQRVSNIA
jgi:hypothetical protein